MTFGELTEDWRRRIAVRHKPSTRKRDESSLRTELLPRFGHRPAASIGKSGVYRWYTEYATRAPAGATRALATLSGIMAHGEGLGVVMANPCKGVKARPVPRRDRWLTAEEVGRLKCGLDEYRAALPANGSVRGASGRQVVDIIRLLLLTGCRSGEISQLQWMEVMPGKLTLADSKTGPRVVPLSYLPEQIIMAQPSRRKRSARWVFPSPRDERVPRSRHLTGWRRIRDMAGLQNVRVHDLRHTWASHAAMAGVPLPVLAKILGHSSTRVTEIYTHIASDHAERAVHRTTTNLVACMGARNERKAWQR